jgi:DNA-binding NarL/FixJ family response regulator
MLSPMPDRARPSTVPAVAVVAADRRVRDGLVSLLTATGIDILGAACDGPTALSLVARRPDAVVLDPRLVAPGDGALVRALRAELPDAPFLVVQWDARVDAGLAQGTDLAVDASALPGALHEALAAHGFGDPATD